MKEKEGNKFTHARTHRVRGFATCCAHEESHVHMHTLASVLVSQLTLGFFLHVT